MKDTKLLSIFNQLHYYSVNTSVTLGDLSQEAFIMLSQIFDTLRDGQEDAGDNPADFTRWDSVDFRMWLADSITNGIYTAENVN